MSLLNTDMKRELDHLAKFLEVSKDYARSQGFKGCFFIDNIINLLIFRYFLMSNDFRMIKTIVKNFKPLTNDDIYDDIDDDIYDDI